MTERLIILMCTGVVGGVIASIVDHGLRETGWYRRIAFGLLGFAVSVAAVEPLLVAMHLERLESRFGWLDQMISDSSAYYGARRTTDTASGLVRVVMGRRVANLESELGNIAKRQTVRISGQEVTNTWRDMVANAERCICATNVVSKKAWSEVGDDGVALQAEAMRGRRVAIVRTFLPDFSNRLHTEQLREIAAQQRTAGIPVYELALNRVTDNPSYEIYRQTLNAVDVVVVDDAVALLTQTDPITHEATSAQLTSDAQMVRVAKEYAIRVLSDAKGAIPSRCD